MNEQNEINGLKNFKISVGKSFAAAFLVMICLQLIAAIIILPSNYFPQLFHITLPLSFLIGGSVAVFVLLPFVNTNWATIQTHLWKPTSLAILLLSVLFYLLMLPFAEYMTSLVPTTGTPFIEKYYNELTSNFEMLLDYKIAGFLTVCIIAPILEEILFRGIILRGLLQKGVPAIAAIFLSSFLFGMAHLNPWQFLGAGILGAVFGFVYYKTQSLWLCIILHALNNTVSFIMMNRFESMDENLTDPNDSMSMVICFALAIFVGWGISKINRNKIKWN